MVFLKNNEKPHGENPDTTSYTYDGMYAVCEFESIEVQYSDYTDKKADYADDGNLLDSEYSAKYLDLKAKYVYANGMLLAKYETSPADTHYFHHDGLGSVMGMTDEAGNVEQSYFYDDFGNSLGAWGSVGNSYLYTGQEYDGAISGLYNLRARYYDPGVGRFISEDPICPGMAKFPLGINPYIYVVNNPINAIDPSGQMPKWKCETTIHQPIFEREPRQWLTHHGQWRFSKPIGIVITPANDMMIRGGVTCYFERENVREIKGRAWKIVPYTTVCVDECGELPPYTVHGEEKTYVGRYTDVKKWTGYCNFTISGEHYGKLAKELCIDNLWRCDR